jgi:hypothetical protein
MYSGMGAKATGRESTEGAGAGVAVALKYASWSFTSLLLPFWRVSVCSGRCTSPLHLTCGPKGMVQVSQFSLPAVAR